MKEQAKGTLQGKIVVVMGGSSGIGLATAKAAAIEGSQVTIVSSNEQRLNHALAQLPANCAARVVDLSKEDNIKSFFEQNENFDHLVYTAGENIVLNQLKDTDLDKARQYLMIRYWGAVASVKYAAPYLNKGGSITLTSGIASCRPGKGWWLGSSITSAMEGYTRAMAVELAPVRVNAVSPGVVRTNLWDSIPEVEREKYYTTVGNSLLVERVGEAEDIAQTYLYLMQQHFGTGQVIFVDGGAVLV